jgi:predicted NUDIX family NTP pyrophosphohydrolase
MRRVKRSAGLLLFRRGASGLEVLLAHPGGPFWADRDDGSWSIPKGEIEAGEEALTVARREFQEETGHEPPDGVPIALATIQQKSGKVVEAWALEGDLDPAAASSNRVLVEWPPRSGRSLEIPEVDRVEWFGPAEARRKLNPAQVAFLERLEDRLDG